MRFHDPNGLSFDVSEIGGYFNRLQYRWLDFMPPFEYRQYRDKGGKTILKPRGTHLCIPVFGHPPQGSQLRGKIPQHGNFRKEKLKLWTFTHPHQGIGAEFCLKGDPQGYVWDLKGVTSFRILGAGNVLEIEVAIRNCSFQEKGPAPINIGAHFYWRNIEGINVQSGDFKDFFSESVPEAKIVPYNNLVRLRIYEVGSVNMVIQSDFQSRPKVVIWSDSDDFTCVELVLDDPQLFDTPQGTWLGEWMMKVKFVLFFSLVVSGATSFVLYKKPAA